MKLGVILINYTVDSWNTILFLKDRDYNIFLYINTSVYNLSYYDKQIII
jgi:hypothetical protein